MTSASMTFGRSTRVAPALGNQLLSALASSAVKTLRRLDNWLLSLQQTEPRDAESVMAWASRIEATEPGFAADLRAAALRSMEKSGR
jgi:hypothetical protein